MWHLLDSIYQVVKNIFLFYSGKKNKQKNWKVGSCINDNI